MKRQTRIFQSVLLTASIAFVSTSQAAVITDTLGDIDCFGTGFTCADGFFGAGDSGAFSTFTGAMTPDATTPVTDQWAIGNEQTWNHSIALSGGETSAALEFRTYALADRRGPYDILINGTSVGTVPIVDTGLVYSSQQIVTHLFNFSPTLLLNGLNTISMSQLDTSGDSWALDYSMLSVSSDSVVPVPATLALLGLGLAGIGYQTRKQSKSV